MLPATPPPATACSAQRLRRLLGSVLERRPMLEAAPFKLLRSANLIGKPESVDIAQLPRFPFAVPLEFVIMHAAVAGRRGELTCELGATTFTPHCDAINGQIRFAVKQLSDRPQHFHARVVRWCADPRRWLPSDVRCEVGAESVGRLRGGQKCGEIIECHSQIYSVLAR